MYLADYLELWYTLYVVSDKRLTDSTKAMYRRSIRALPASLGASDLRVIDDIALLKWLRAVEQQHPRAAQLDRLMLRRSLRIAYKLHYIDYQLMDQETVPPIYHTSAKASVLTMEQLRAYLSAAEQHSLGALLLLAACGLRRGECLGCRWSDVDQERHTLHVCRQRLRIGGKYQAKKLKTASSDRVILLPDAVFRALMALPRTVSGYLVDCTPERMQAAHRAILTASGVPQITIHGLRHTVATLAAQTQTITEVQHALGHSKYQLTADLYANHITAPSDVVFRLWSAM